MRSKSWLASAAEAPSDGALTATETRVAELVAEGLQTKQVAAALFVSQKTVEGHLTHIYGKLASAPGPSWPADWANSARP